MPLDRFRDELFVLYRLDVARLDRAEHFGKGAQLVHRKREARRFAAEPPRRSSG